MKLDFYKDRKKYLYKLDHDTKKAYVWSYKLEKWEACWDHIYTDIAEPDIISVVRNKYRGLKKVTEKEAFIEIL